MPENDQGECPCLYPCLSSLDMDRGFPVKFAIAAYFKNKETINKRENAQEASLLYYITDSLYC